MNYVRLRGCQFPKEHNINKTCRDLVPSFGSYLGASTISSIRYHHSPPSTWNPLFHNLSQDLKFLSLNAKISSILPKRFYASRRYTRQERIDEAKYTSQSNLNAIDDEYEIFTEKVTKVVDLGSAPGTWLNFACHRLSHLHDVKPEELYKKCTVIGLDLLFCQPPRGTFYSQGNIYSQNTHTQIEQLLKEAEFKKNRPEMENENDSLDMDQELSYISKEIRELQLEASLENESSELSSIPSYSFQADVVLSDLGPASLQEVGFHNNTISKPYIRSSQNPALRRPWDNPGKSSIDMAEAALLLCGAVLAKHGNFVLRLPSVDLSDPELMLLESRLLRVFHHVSRWSDNGRITSDVPKRQPLFMICQGKRDHTIDKHEVFGVKRKHHK